MNNILRSTIWYSEQINELIMFHHYADFMEFEWGNGKTVVEGDTWWSLYKFKKLHPDKDFTFSYIGDL